MIKNNRWKLILASALILFPMAVGGFLWDRFPWDTWGKLCAILILPLILLALFWGGVLLTAWDHKEKEQDKKVLGMVFFILPILSLTVHGFFYALALGMEFNPMHVIGLFFAILFLLIGN